MKAKGAASFGALAVVGLIAAYVTWQRPPDTSAQGDVVVLDVSKKQLQKVRYEDPRRWVELVRAESDSPVFVTELVKPPPPHPPVAGGDAGTPEPIAASVPEPKAKTLKGGDQAKSAYDGFAPLVASRSLGKLDAKKLEELGLAKTDRSLVVTSTKGTSTFKVGQPGAGIVSTYLLSDDGTVYVLGSQVLANFEYASARIVDRRLHVFEPDSFDEVTVKAEGKERRFSQANRKLTSTDKPGKPDDYASNWHERLSRLAPAELLGQGEVPPSGEPKIQLRVDYLSKGKPVGFLEAGNSGDALYVRTEHTAGWVKMHSTAGDVMLESRKVVDAS